MPPAVATFPLHPLAHLLPELSAEEQAALTASIREQGQLTPATSWLDGDGVEWLIDGRHRAAACHELGITLRVEPLEGDEAAARAFVLAANVTRRHLSPSQRAVAAAALATRGRGESGIAADSLTQVEAARIAHVSPRLVRAARVFAGDANLTEAVVAGEMTVTEAERIARSLGQRGRRALRLELSRQSESQEWLTPTWITDRVTQLLERIDGDPCAEPGKRVPAGWHLTEDEDGLQQSWANPGGSASRVFLNPPWEKSHVWVRKLLREVDAGRVEQALVLLPARLGSEYVAALTSRGWPRVELTGRLRFDPGRGAQPTSRGEAHAATMLVGVNVEAQRMWEAFGDVGVVMRAWVP